MFRLVPNHLREVQSFIARRIVCRMTMNKERVIRFQSAPSGTSDLAAHQHFVAAVSPLRQYAPACTSPRAIIWTQAAVSGALPPVVTPHVVLCMDGHATYEHLEKLP
ncbi:hypothetical protein EYC08_18285 [Tabrizicola sp. WMC-M-20]|nr:hypothetical protein EYC08_18285 [Tabrizicola sp. WMC-M-20]